MPATEGSVGGWRALSRKACSWRFAAIDPFEMRERKKEFRGSS
jgi:hypothetical protein